MENTHRLKISRLFPYPQLLKRGKERLGAIFLDIGCCCKFCALIRLGNDIRKAIADGYPVENVIASDLQSSVVPVSGKSPKSLISHFQDAFSPSHLAIVKPSTEVSTTPAPALNTLTSLNPLHGHVSAIHASALFHLFDDQYQLRLARALAGLLFPEPGSMIFGRHAGLPHAGWVIPGKIIKDMYCHSQKSWEELWNEQIFGKGTVKVETELTEAGEFEVSRCLQPPPGVKFYWLTWSVTRL
ncbi:hypothetical protein BV25DRAFT_1878320 [Artomyces pyxidatus]|uniref:Uncharacterized protein n=1 Tax=Artomyces pyxidatus TaxID=48021 RepID=A0ACB8TDA7_9AGAM|nr:hypothetical protein BV25DRAFT_1878320 [Artomyces pyxidatus]